MKKSKLLTLGLLAGAGLLLSINQAQAADTWVKNGADWNLSQDGSLAKDKWVQNAGSWYHFDGTGKMQTGWLKRWEYMVFARRQWRYAYWLVQGR